MRRQVRGSVLRKHSGKVVLPANVISGLTPKTVLRLADTDYYQVGPAGDYIQEVH